MSSGGGGDVGSSTVQGASAGAATGNPYAAAAGATLGLLSGLSQQNAMKVQASFEKERAKTNAMLIDMQRRDVLEQGDSQADEYEKEVAQMIGAQTTSFAAQGIDVNTGTAAAIRNQTRETGDQDITSIKNNAWKQAWGLEVEAEATRERGKMASEATLVQGKQRVISAGINAVNTGLKYYKNY